MDKKVIKKEFGELIETLTPKQAKFFDLWLKTGNGTRSALEAYDTTNVDFAAVIANQTLRKLKSPVKTFLENNGVSLGYLTKILIEASKAERTDASTGEKYADHKTRIEAVDRLSKWLELEPKESLNPTVAVQFNLTRGEEDEKH